MAGFRTMLHSPQCPSWPGRPPTVPEELPLLLGRAQIGILGPGPLAPGSRKAGSDSGREGQPCAQESPSAAGDGPGGSCWKKGGHCSEADPLPQQGYTPE